jgi:hypothetical protein
MRIGPCTQFETALRRWQGRSDAGAQCFKETGGKPMTDKCFMIQPFDGGKFDKRFDEVFKPAVTAAGLEPYRVDRDPGASIPIEEIETGIRQSAICFADVTLDNPNVWFELGYAIAVGKDICIVSSEERQTKYPFDIQHRKIIKYKVESPSDYANLGT